MTRPSRNLEACNYPTCHYAPHADQSLPRMLDQQSRQGQDFLDYLDAKEADG